MASTIGDQELALLQHLAERGEATVGEVAARFGSARGLARSTVLTMMERLRRKGHVSRRVVAGVYRYASHAPAETVLRDAVRAFVERTLGGSVSPFVAYLSDEAEVGDEEAARLEQLLDRLQARRREP
jgi:predicted transcriptional regulator